MLLLSSALPAFPNKGFRIAVNGAVDPDFNTSRRVRFFTSSSFGAHEFLSYGHGLCCFSYAGQHVEVPVVDHKRRCGK